MIGSHTISKALGLRDLAVQGHVLGLRYDFGTLSKTKGRADVGKIGINKMSVFPGFCAKHDKKFFSEVEDKTFSGTPEQCALLSYRAIAREMHAKLGGIDTNEYIKASDTGRPLNSQMAIQAATLLYGLGLDAARSDLERALKAHQSSVQSGDFSAFQSSVWEFPPEFPILCSTGHMPDEDWNGKVIQDLSDPSLEADWATATSIQSGGKSWVIFTWLRKSGSPIPEFVASLRERFKGNEADALIKYFFTVSENIAISPSWWARLDRQSRDALMNRVMDGTPFVQSTTTNTLRPRQGEPIVLDLPVLNSFEV